LRTKGVRTSLWEKTIERLRGLDIEADAAEIAPVLRSVERRLARYIASGVARQCHQAARL
jgi:putative ATP-dependent endonuclease of OLD family